MNLIGEKLETNILNNSNKPEKLNGKIFISSARKFQAQTCVIEKCPLITTDLVSFSKKSSEKKTKFAGRLPYLWIPYARFQLSADVVPINVV